ncbi:MAG: type II toxin-antitoxin system prevent-host-death family antitoxin [Deltaproteobacteria bacterium]|nr:type II toxin-antitoxin system prevent-host-death family antitoxin [Deltaproteobacteria bacterium]
MDTFVNATEAGQRFLQLLDDLQEGDQGVVTRHGIPVAVLIDIERLETLKSLVKLWQDPKVLRAMTEASEQVKEGHVLRMTGVPKIEDILKTARTQGFLRG